jgi:hypothetical protein
MVRERWWPLAGNKSGIKKPRRRGKRVREVFLGPEIVLSGELKSCGTLVAEGMVDGSRIECQKFILGSTGSCKGEVQTVRRQGFRDNGLSKLREALAHRVGAVRRPAAGAASGG